MSLDLLSCSLRPAAQHPGWTWPDGTQKPNNNHANHKPGIRNSKRIQDPELDDLEFGDLPSQYPREYPICNVLNCPQGIEMPFFCALALVALRWTSLLLLTPSIPLPSAIPTHLICCKGQTKPSFPPAKNPMGYALLPRIPRAAVLLT
jgi:hypothetical protein